MNEKPISKYSFWFSTDFLHIEAFYLFLLVLFDCNIIVGENNDYYYDEHTSE